MICEHINNLFVRLRGCNSTVFRAVYADVSHILYAHIVWIEYSRQLAEVDCVRQIDSVVHQTNNNMVKHLARLVCRFYVPWRVKVAEDHCLYVEREVHDGSHVVWWKARQLNKQEQWSMTRLYNKSMWCL